MAGLIERPVEQLDERGEAASLATDDAQNEREAEPCGAHHRLRGAADADPAADPSGFRLRKTCWLRNGGRTDPDQVTGPSVSSRAISSAFSENSLS
ncbi:hypothetical protein [Actinoplanes solisilvae]|uniref:hypothetical protein n=1 Tax=Actinoplanes solisilvae TaxID=2486853 RepID=UPI001F0BBFCE|nr:hypothetical protein [Actinoplanes solisilvae]